MLMISTQKSSNKCLYFMFRALCLDRLVLLFLLIEICLISSPSLLLAAKLPGDFFAICDDGGEPLTNNQNDFVSAPPGVLKIWQFDSDKAQIINLPFACHSISQNLIKPNELAVFSLWSDQAAILDIKEKKPPRLIKEEAGHRFFGHGVFSKDGKRLFTTGQNDTTGIGEVSLWDVTSQKLVSRFSVFGFYPYDIKLSNSGNELIVAVAGRSKDSASTKPKLTLHMSEESSLTYLSYPNGEFIKRIEFTEHDKSILHFEISSDSWIVGAGQSKGLDVSGQKSFAVSISPSGIAKNLVLPDDFLGNFTGETLGIALYEKKSLAYLTNRSTKLIIVWNYKKQELQKYFYIPDRPKAISITNDQKQILISETKTKSFLLIDPIKMDIVGRASGNELSGYGAHLIRIKNFN